MENEIKLVMPVIFEKDNVKFQYDFNLLNVEQAELAREAGEYKANTIQNPPENFTQLIKSRAVEWLTIIMSYLLVEVVNDIPQSFSIAISETKTQTFVKSLPVAELQRMRDCVNHFFTSINMNNISSAILQGVRQPSIKEILFPMLVQMMTKKDDTLTS